MEVVAKTRVQFPAAPPFFIFILCFLPIYTTMKVSKEQIKDLIKGVVHEMSTQPEKTPSNDFFSDMDAANASHAQKRESLPPIEYAVRVVRTQSHEGYQLKAEALIWDETEIDVSEVNHIKTELERMVEQFIKDKNRNARRIR